MRRYATPAAVAALLPMAGPALPQDAEDLAQQLANPVASLISVPLQFNLDEGIGPGQDGSRLLLNLQPVVPVSLGTDWNLISRTIVPLVHQSDIAPGTGSQTGVGDIVQSFFFSPKAPTLQGLIWGVGPVLLLPTASDDLLGAGKWGAGPTAVALMQRGPWTVGGLANHIWSFAGDDDRTHINRAFLQPFVSYTSHDAWTFSLQTESTYDWETDQWTVPVNAVVSKLVGVGDQPVSLFGGVRYWADGPDSGPEGWGVRFGATLLFPRTR